MVVGSFHGQNIHGNNPPHPPGNEQNGNNNNHVWKFRAWVNKATAWNQNTAPLACSYVDPASGAKFNFEGLRKHSGFYSGTFN